MDNDGAQLYCPYCDDVYFVPHDEIVTCPICFNDVDF